MTKAYHTRKVLVAATHSIWSDGSKARINPAALFSAQPGRVGADYGASYDEILAQNRSALGPELVTNGDFSNGLTGWTTVPAQWVISGGALTKSANTLNPVIGTAAVLAGKTYLCEFSITAQTAAGSGVSIRIGGTVGGFQSGTGKKVEILTAASTGSVELLARGASGDWLGVIDDISVREIVDWSKLVLFDDPNGTVPVFSVFQTSRGRGLLLDRSKGLVRGPELVANGSFDSGQTNWSFTTPGAGQSVSFSAGQVTVTTDGAYVEIAQPGILTSGKWYEITLDVAAQTGAPIAAFDGSLSPVFLPGTGLRTIILRATTNSFLVKRSGAGSFTLNSVSVRELPGNHMVQPTAAARGELSRLYNLLTGTDGATWSKTGQSAPLTEDSTNGIHEMRTSTVSLVAGVSYTQTAIVRKKGTRRYFRFGVGAAFGVGGFCVFDLDTGTITYSNNAAVVGSMSAVAGSPGVFNCNITFTPSTTATNTNYLGVNSNATTGASYAGTAGEGFELIGADLRLSADAIASIPAYQRVTSATDYDEAGFPAHHREQTDDWAYADIDPAGATKLLAMWAGQKMSDAAAGVVFESSDTSATTAGTAALFAPSAASAVYGFRSRGSGNSIATTGTTFAAPRRDAIRAVSDIAADANTLYVNGAQAASAVTDQGTGAFTSQRVYFGARAGTSLFANIREFAPPMLLFMQSSDPGLSAREIALLDKRFAKAAGVTL